MIGEYVDGSRGGSLMAVSSRSGGMAGLTPDQELARVMAEVVTALGGVGAVLTLHPTAQAPEVVYADSDQLAEIAAALFAANALGWEHDEADRHLWVTGSFAPHDSHALVVPVRPVAGHSRLIITVFFDNMDAETHAVAEAAYLARRPFAVGYFRLWQQDRLHHRANEVLRLALDRVGLAVLLITRAGEVAFANTGAQQLLDQGTGIYQQRGRVQARKRTDNATLNATLYNVIDCGPTSSTSPLLTIERDGAASLTVAITPSPYVGAEDGEIGAIMFVVDPEMDITDLATAVCQAVRLTRVETDLACKLASGRSLQEAAIKMNIKEDTARSYLRTIFAKTGVNRQSDLVRLILVSLMRTTIGRSPGLTGTN